MNSNNIQSINEAATLFNSESNKLENSIHQLLNNSKEFTISEIIQVYYQVINIKSLEQFLKLNLKNIKNKVEQKTLEIRIQENEKYVDEKFDSNLHLLIITNLNKMIDECKTKLKDISTKNNKKTKENLENQAKTYEKLRQIMSTKEFVNQYSNRLINPK